MTQTIQWACLINRGLILISSAKFTHMVPHLTRQRLSVCWPQLLPPLIPIHPVVPGKIRIEFHVAWLSHALACIDLLYSCSQVIPDLVQPNLFEPVGVLAPVGWHCLCAGLLVSDKSSLLPVLLQNTAASHVVHHAGEHSDRISSGMSTTTLHRWCCRLV